MDTGAPNRRPTFGPMAGSRVGPGRRGPSDRGAGPLGAPARRVLGGRSESPLPPITRRLVRGRKMTRNLLMFRNSLRQTASSWQGWPRRVAEPRLASSY